MSSILEALKKLEAEKASQRRSVEDRSADDLERDLTGRGGNRVSARWVALTLGIVVVAAIAIGVSVGVSVMVVGRANQPHPPALSAPVAQPLIAQIQATPKPEANTEQPPTPDSPASPAESMPPSPAPAPETKPEPVQPSTLDTAQAQAIKPTPEPAPAPEPQPAPQPEPKADSKVESKSEPKDEPNTETKAETTSEPKPAPKTEPKPEPAPAPQEKQLASARISSSPFSVEAPKPPAITSAKPAEDRAPQAAVPAAPVDIAAVAQHPLRETDKQRLGLTGLQINMLQPATKHRPIASAIINLNKVYVGETIPRTKARLLAVDGADGIVIEIPDTKERFYVSF